MATAKETVKTTEQQLTKAREEMEKVCSVIHALSKHMYMYMKILIKDRVTDRHIDTEL